MALNTKVLILIVAAWFSLGASTSVAFGDPDGDRKYAPEACSGEVTERPVIEVPHRGAALIFYTGERIDPTVDFDETEWRVFSTQNNLRLYWNEETKVGAMVGNHSVGHDFLRTVLMPEDRTIIGGTRYEEGGKRKPSNKLAIPESEAVEDTNFEVQVKPFSMDDL